MVVGVSAQRNVYVTVSALSVMEIVVLRKNSIKGMVIVNDSDEEFCIW